MFESPNARVSERICSQVTAYLAALANMGAFESERFVVDCDAGLCPSNGATERGVTILVTFQPAGAWRSMRCT